MNVDFFAGADPRWKHTQGSSKGRLMGAGFGSVGKLFVSGRQRKEG
jgi:hypothetical protein